MARVWNTGKRKPEHKSSNETSIAKKPRGLFKRYVRIISNVLVPKSYFIFLHENTCSSHTKVFKKFHFIYRKQLLDMKSHITVVMLRFPHLAEQILQKLDNQGLAKSRKVVQAWQKFIDERDYPWLRIVNIPTVLAKGNTYLHLAAKHGHIDPFKMLLPFTASRTNDSGATPFLIACSKGCMNIVAMLMKTYYKLKINLTASDNDGLTGFHLACKNGYSEIAEMIMNNSSRLEINLNLKDKRGQTAFHLACMEGHFKIAEIIINKSLKLKIDLSTKNKEDSTAFHLACFHGRLEVAKLIMKNSSRLKIDWNGKDVFDTTAFQLVCLKGHLRIAEMIMNNSANLKIDLNMKGGHDGSTAFHFACVGGDSAMETFKCARVVEMIIEQSECHKIDLTAKDDYGQNGYKAAEHYKNIEVIKLIKTKMPSLVV